MRPPESAAFSAVNRRKSWWNNQTYEEQVALAIIDNKGGLVTGPAGTGKSVILKQLRAHLKGEKVFTCAYTHAAARLTGGMTVARLLHYDTRLHDAWILIDEISLLPINTIGMMARLLLVGAKFVCSEILTVSLKQCRTVGMFLTAKYKARNV